MHRSKTVTINFLDLSVVLKDSAGCQQMDMSRSFKTLVCSLYYRSFALQYFSKWAANFYPLQCKLMTA